MEFPNPAVSRDTINVFYLWDLRIEEPIVTITDLLVTVLCAYFFWVFYKSRDKSKTITFFKYYNLLMAIATLSGGIFGHGFLYAVPHEMKLIGWITSMFSIMLIERTAIEHAGMLFPGKMIRALRVINVVELIFFLGVVSYSVNFFFFELHSGYGLMFVVLSLEGWLFLKTRNKASLNMLIGIAAAGAAALIFMNDLNVHQWFNSRSFSHIWMAVASIFFFRGGLEILKQNEAKSSQEAYRSSLKNTL